MDHDEALAKLLTRATVARDRTVALADQSEVREQIVTERRRQAGVGEGRWRSRHRLGAPRQRRPQPGFRSRPRRRARRRRGRVVVRAKKSPAAHRRLGRAELRARLAAGGFAGFMERMVAEALKDGSGLGVVVCSCGLISRTPADQCDDVWAKHVGEVRPTRQEPTSRPSFPAMVLAGARGRRARHRLVRRLRRSQRRIAARGVLARVRAKHAEAGWDYAAAGRMVMASRFWVGGAGTWDNASTTHWAATTGGASGASAPTSSDDAVFDSASGTGTVTVAGTAVCLSFTGTGSTLVMNGGATVSGSVTFGAGQTTSSGAASWNLIGTGAHTVNTNGVSIANSVVVIAGVGSYTFSSAVTAPASITLTSGTLNTNGQTVSTGSFVSSNSNARSLILGASAVTVTGSFPWQANNSTNFTLTANTSTVTFPGATAVVTVDTGVAKTFNNVVFSGSGAASVSGATNYANLTRTGTAVKTDSLSFAGTQTVSSTFTVTGNSLINRVLVQSSVLGTARTVSAAAVSLSNADFTDIAGSGVAAPFTGTSLGNGLGNSGITFTVAVTRFAVVAGNWSSTATWSATTGGAGGASVPLSQDTVTFDANSATGTYTADMPRAGADVTCTGFTRTLVIGTNITVYGSMTLASGMTFTASNNVTIAGRSTHTITSAAKVFGVLAFTGPGGTYTFQDALTTTSTFGPQAGTVNANGFAVSAGTVAFAFGAGLSRTLVMGSGAWSVTGTSGAVWNNAAAALLTLTVTGASLSFTGTSGTPTITTGATLMPNTTFNGAGGSWTLSDSFSAASTSITVTLTAGTLNTNGQTVVSGLFATSGSGTRTLTMGSSAITLNAGGSNAFNSTVVTGLTVTTNTATMTLNGASTTFVSATFNFNGLTLAFTGSGGAFLNGGTPNTFANVTRTGTAVKTDTFGTNGAFTATGTITLTGNSLTNRLLMQSNSVGTQRTLTAATVSLTNVDFQDTAAAGAAAWSGTSVGDALGNSGITFTVAVTRFAVVAGNWSSTTTWSATTGGAGGASVPLPQDTVTLNASSAAGTYTADMPRLGADITCTGFTRTLSLGANVTNYGSLTLATGMTFSTSFTWVLSGRGTHTLTMAGKSFPGGVQFTAPGGTYTLQDAYSSVASLQAVSGTLNANNQTVAASAFVSNSGFTRAVTMGTGAWTLTASSGGSSWLLAATGLTLTVTGNTTSFTATSGTNGITTSAITMPNVTFNGAGGTWQFSDAFTTAGTITLTSGTLDTNGKSVSAATFSSSGAVARTLTLGLSAVTITGTGSSWSTGTVTNLTVTANTGTVTQSGASVTFSSGVVNWNGMSLVQTGSGTTLISGSQTFANFTRTGTAVKTDSVAIGTLTCTGTFTATGNSTTNRVLVQSSVFATARTVTTATVTSTNADWQDITAAGAASWNLSAATGGSGDALGNSGITFTPAVTRFGVVAGNWSSTATWSASTGGAGGASVPLSQDAVVLDASSAAGTYSVDMPRAGATITCTGFTRILSTTASTSVYGSITLASGMTLSGTSAITLSGRGSHTLTSAGKSWTMQTVVTAPGGTYTLADAYSSSRVSSALGLSFGTLNDGGRSVTTPDFAVNGSSTRVLTMTGSWSLSTTIAGNGWAATSTGLTVNASTSTIAFTGATSNSKSFAGAGFTYGTLAYTVAASTGPLVITGANTFATLDVESEAGNAKTLTLPAATVTTITSTLRLIGVATARLTVNSSTAASAAQLVAAAGRTIDVQFVALSDNAASGGATFLAQQSTLGSNVSGWTGSSYVLDVGTVGTVAQDLSTVIGAQSFVVGLAAVGLAAQTAALVVEPQSLILDAAAVPIVGLDAESTVGAQSLTLEAAVVALVASDPDAVIAAQSFTLEVAAAGVDAQVPTVVIGPQALVLDAAVLAAVAKALAVVIAPQSLVLAAGALPVVAQRPYGLPPLTKVYVVLGDNGKTVVELADGGVTTVQILGWSV